MDAGVCCTGGLFTSLGGITFLVTRKSLIACLYMWVVQVDFDFFGSCASGGIPLQLPWDGPVLPGLCILQCGPCNPASHRGQSPSLITTPAWGRGTAHPRGPNNCCYRQTRDRGHQHLHTTGLKNSTNPKISSDQNS